jgi:hypothetical protein
MQSADDDDESDSPTEQKRRRAAGMVSAPESSSPIAITVAYVSPEMAEKQEGQSFTYKWPREDDSLVVTMNSLGSSTSLSDLTQSLVHSIPDSTRTIRAIWAVTVEDDGVLKAARKDKVVILHDDQALSGWLARASHLTDPLLYVVYHRNPSDPARPDSPIPGNRPFFDQSALLPEAPDIPVYDIDEEEDVEDSAFKEKPRSLPWSRASLKKREIIVQKRIIRQQRMLKCIRARAVGFYADWTNTDVDESEVTWLNDNPYIINPPLPGTISLPKKK